MTNLVQLPGLGLSFELDRVAFSIGGMNIYWYGVCIAVGMCLALVFAFRDVYKRQLQTSGKFIPWQVVTISIDGKILD